MKQQNSLKQSYIVRIVDEYHVIVNLGAVDGIKNGDRFEIYIAGDRELIDPITGDSLGTFDTILGRVNAMDVREKYTICSSNTGELGRRLLSDLSDLTYKGQPIRLNINTKDISGYPGGDLKRPIQVGDAVRKVPQEEISSASTL
jgi:hypothetical protein